MISCWKRQPNIASRSASFFGNYFPGNYTFYVRFFDFEEYHAPINIKLNGEIKAEVSYSHFLGFRTISFNAHLDDASVFSIEAFSDDPSKPHAIAIDFIALTLNGVPGGN